MIVQPSLYPKGVERVSEQPDKTGGTMHSSPRKSLDQLIPVEVTNRWVDAEDMSIHFANQQLVLSEVWQPSTDLASLVLKYFLKITQLTDFI